MRSNQLSYTPYFFFSKEQQEKNLQQQTSGEQPLSLYFREEDFFIFVVTPKENQRGSKVCEYVNPLPSIYCLRSEGQRLLT
jgi:hypothetical protein